MVAALKPAEAAHTLLRALQRFYAQKRFCDVKIMHGERVGEL